MSTITTEDGTEIYFKDWGEGPAVTLSHGWPLSADAWDGQMLFLAQKRLPRRRARPSRSRPVEPDVVGQRHERVRRRPRGVDRDARPPRRDRRRPLDRRRRSRAVHRPARHRPRRESRADLRGAAGASSKSDANPDGLPVEAFDAIRGGLAADRSQFYRDLAQQFYGANRPGSTVSQGVLDQFWQWSMQSGLKNSVDTRLEPPRVGLHRLTSSASTSRRC